MALAAWVLSPGFCHVVAQELGQGLGAVWTGTSASGNGIRILILWVARVMIEVALVSCHQTFGGALVLIEVTSELLLLIASWSNCYESMSPCFAS
ncbi:hypothetical protein AMTR_s00107p00151740 [Amborella trichopoda]|uniref:Uncharacterized protein n=1 Tax=Amborella trichopoda TaxID=13333 RepID=W1P046_AMBTC|nr:hypothetical protein AMTR_s00107p00151740 [Amborella trichopoda]